MSDGSEYLSDNAYEIEQSQRRWEALCIEAEMEAYHGLWRCKDGRVMNVTEMETSHIQNCIKMLERHDSPFKKSYTKMFNAELERRANEF